MLNNNWVGVTWVFVRIFWVWLLSIRPSQFGSGLVVGLDFEWIKRCFVLESLGVGVIRYWIIGLGLIIVDLGLGFW